MVIVKVVVVLTALAVLIPLLLVVTCFGILATSNIR
jgi:hypothetical protein